jgi:hypothetical protein
MAASNQIREAVEAQPFRPFVIRLSDGRNYKVEHSEFAMLSPNGMELLFLADDQGIHQIYVPLIVEIETPSSQQAQPGPNGNGT